MSPIRKSVESHDHGICARSALLTNLWVGMLLIPKGTIPRGYATILRLWDEALCQALKSRSNTLRNCSAIFTAILCSFSALIGMSYSDLRREPCGTDTPLNKRYKHCASSNRVRGRDQSSWRQGNENQSNDQYGTYVFTSCIHNSRICREIPGRKGKRRKSTVGTAPGETAARAQISAATRAEV